MEAAANILAGLGSEAARLFLASERGALVVYLDRIDLGPFLDLQASQIGLPLSFLTETRDVVTDPALFEHLFTAALGLVEGTDRPIIVGAGDGRLTISIPARQGALPTGSDDVFSRRSSSDRRRVARGEDARISLLIRLADQLDVGISMHALGTRPDDPRVCLSVSLAESAAAFPQMALSS